MMHDADRHIPVIISQREPQAFARGGLARAAKDVASSGRYGDDMVIHVNKDEFQQLRKEWGEPTINPKTGMPEFFLSGIRKWFSDNPWASVALPAATSLLGVGNLVGGGINDAFNLNLSPTVANSLGSALTGGVTGGLTGGGSGALTGALIGGASPLVSNFVTGGDGRGILGGLFGSGSSEGSVFGNLNGVSGGDSATNANNVTTSNNPLSGPASTASSSGALGGLGGGIGNLLTSKNAIPLAIGALALASGFASKKPSAAAQAAAAQNSAATAAFNRPLASNVTFDRTYVPLTAEEARNYGTHGGRPQYLNNRLPAVAAARGGLSQAAPMMPTRAAGKHVTGPGGGRDDTIPAYLSNDEYVMDAESVALLGNGSPKAGAKKLDQLRAGLREHKGKALAKGKISPDAKDPAHYMKGGRS
jgi:hypothetical protein